VNVLSRDQHEVARRFARKGSDKFEGVQWRFRNELPHFDGCGVWLECELTSCLDGGDHVIITGLVRRTDTTPCEPLLYRNRTFGTLHPHDQPSSGL